MNEWIPPSLIIFMLLYFISFLFIINSDDWFLIWVGLELNMLSFLMLIYQKNSLNYIESCLKYFFVQSVGSAMLMGLFYLSGDSFLYFGSIILSYKMGAGPFYFWFPSVCGGLGWFSCFMLMSIQKLIPLMLMVFFISWILWGLVIISLVFGVMGSLNQKELKLLMAFSSIHHLGWLMLCISIDSSVWIYYLMLYSIVIFPIIMLLMMFKINDLMILGKWSSKWWFVMCMLSMAGMPPFLGFFLKWMAFYYIINMDFSMILFMIFMSVGMFYVYIRVLYDFLTGAGSEVSWVYNLYSKKYMMKVDFFVVFGLLFGLIFMMMIFIY